MLDEVRGESVRLSAMDSGIRTGRLRAGANLVILLTAFGLCLGSIALGAESAAARRGPGVSVAAKRAGDAEQTAANRALALALAERTRQTITPTLHLIETQHFLIFSAWNTSNDSSLAVLCEQMFEKLVEQFGVRNPASVWIGKCPVYLFWEPVHYARFISEVDQSEQLDPNMAHATGYHASRGGFAYVVINGVSAFGTNLEEARLKFYHVLVHEGTHAFLHRFVSPRPLPLWLEEGLADYLAATLVPRSEANRVYLIAARRALTSPDKVRQLLDKEEDLSPNEYGLAQSIVRFLLVRDRTGVIKLVQLIKRGAHQQPALREAYHLSPADLVKSWTGFWQHQLLRRT
jgi:hypothetical protein